MSNRPTWNEYFMEMAHLVSKRATCLGRNVGAVIVKDNRILTTGYNGSPQGVKHCDTRGCLRRKMEIPSGERQELCFGTHAEQNAIIQAAKMGISIDGASIYITITPCVVCAKMLINVGIKEIFVNGEYPDKMAMELLKEANVKVTKL